MKPRRPKLVAHTMFCDFVTDQADQRFTPFGVYASTLIIDGAEAEIPRLTAFTILELPPKYRSTIGHIALMEGRNVLAENTFPFSEIQLDEECDVMLVQMRLEVGPLILKHGMELQVVFDAGAFKYRSFGLLVTTGTYVPMSELPSSDGSPKSKPKRVNLGTVH